MEKSIYWAVFSLCSNFLKEAHFCMKFQKGSHFNSKSIVYLYTHPSNVDNHIFVYLSIEKECNLRGTIFCNEEERLMEACRKIKLHMQGSRLVLISSYIDTHIYVCVLCALKCTIYCLCMITAVRCLLSLSRHQSGPCVSLWT